MASERCVCPCHTHSGTYPPPCNFCGHDTRDGRWVGGYRGWWEPNNDPRDEQIGRLTALLDERDAEITRLREALELELQDEINAILKGGSALTAAKGQADIDQSPYVQRLRAALAARGGEGGG